MSNDRDVLLNLILDYSAILSPQAIQTYFCYYLVKDKNDIADVTYASLTDHFNCGTATSTIAGVNEQLKDASLIEIIERDEFNKLDDSYEPTRKQLIRVLPVKAFSPEARKEMFRKAGLNVNSLIREQALSLDNLPMEYLSLLSIKDLRLAFQKLGKDDFTISSLIAFFKLDKERVRLWLSSRTFKTQLVKAMKEVAEEGSREEAEEELAKIKKKNNKDGKPPSQLFGELMHSNIDKEGNELPIERWNTVQILRYFCLVYEKYNERKYTLIFGRKNNLICREMRELAMVMQAFDGDAAQVVSYIDWIFREKNKVLRDGILNTAIIKTTGMINEYKKKASRPIEHRDTDPIREDFVSWVKENIPGIFKQYDFGCMKDLYWIKESYDQGVGTEEVKKLVTEGIKRKIVPEKGNLLFKRG